MPNKGASHAPLNEYNGLSAEAPRDATSIAVSARRRPETLRIERFQRRGAPMRPDTLQI